MLTIIQIAWKNIWRNKLRSLVVIASITLGLVGGIFYLAFGNGMVQSQVNSTIKNELANIQIHNPKYLENDETKYFIRNSNEVINRIKNIKGVNSIAKRIKTNAMISSATNGSGVILNGIDVYDERKVFDLDSHIIEGSFFDEKLKNPIVIGKKLADKLKIKLRSKIVVTLQSVDNNIIYGAFRVAGIFKTHNTNFDVLNSFVLKNDLAKLLNTDIGNVNEILISLNHNSITDSTTAKILKMFSSEIKSGAITVRSWKEVNPVLKMMNEMTMQFSMIFVVIILIALSFGIINTMLMAIMERVREIGMLMAIGMSKLKIFLMIMIETVFLSITGGFIGIIISSILIEITYKTGIDLSVVAEGLNAWGYSSFVHPELEFEYYLLIVILVLLTAVFASLFPARKALRLIPSEAVRQDV